MARAYAGRMALPLRDRNWNCTSLASAIAALGYPGFRHSNETAPQDPAEVILGALAADNLETRLAEALPWIAMECANLNWDWLIREVKHRDLQNRLGFVVTLARQLAEKSAGPVAARLRAVEEVLDRARLPHEDTLCQSAMSDAEWTWLRRTRSANARHWRLLTDLAVEKLPYAA